MLKCFIEDFVSVDIKSDNLEMLWMLMQTQKSVLNDTVIRTSLV